MEIELSATKFKYNLKDPDILRDRPIRAIVVCKTGKAISNGQDLADPSNAYLSLKERASNDIRRDKLPLRNFLYEPQFPLLQAVEFEPRTINFDDSFIEFPSTAAPTANTTLQLVIYYDFAKIPFRK